MIVDDTYAVSRIVGVELLRAYRSLSEYVDYFHALLTINFMVSIVEEFCANVVPENIDIFAVRHPRSAIHYPL